MRVLVFYGGEILELINKGQVSCDILFSGLAALFFIYFFKII